MIVVTGATGFVGRRLIRMLAERYGPENLQCLVHERGDDPLERTGRAVLDELGVRYVPVELTSGRGLERAAASPRMLFHLASNTDTGAADHRINDIGTRNLLDAVAPLGPEAHVLFTSSIAVSDHRSDGGRPVDEDTVLLRPFSDYGRRKLAAEQLLRERALRDGWRLSIIRLSAVFARGTRQGGLFDRLSAMAQRKSLAARLNYPGRLSFIAAEDVGRVLVRLSEHPPAPRACELYIPVAEVMSIADLIRLYHDAHRTTYSGIALPVSFWRCCDAVARALFRLEPIVPRPLYNRLWQLGLVVGDGFYNRSDKIQRRFPDLALRRVSETLPEMIA